MTKHPLNISIFVAFYIFSMFALDSHASTVVQTNKARVQVSDQQTSTRRSALQDAFAQVLTKMSGSKVSLEHPRIRAALRSPAKYLVAYEYDQQQDTQYYVGEFSREAIVDLLRQANLPLWGQRRPDTLLWLVVQENRDKWILREGQPDPLAGKVQQEAEQRGIPLTLPLMDLTDNSRLSVYDIWGLFADRLAAASSRYQPDVILAARIRQHDGEQAPEFLSTEEQLAEALANSSLAFSYDSQPTPTPNKSKDKPITTATPDDNSQFQALTSEPSGEDDGPGFGDDMLDSGTRKKAIAKPASMPSRIGEGAIRLDWLMVIEGNNHFGSIFAQDVSAAATKLLNLYSNYLSERFAFSFEKQTQQSQTITISVANLDELKKYIHVQRFLSDMSVVDSAMLVKQAGSVAAFQVSLAGSQDDFMNAISLDSQLRPVTDTFGRPLNGLNFYWNE